jgi:hypothetical protein
MGAEGYNAESKSLLLRTFSTDFVIKIKWHKSAHRLQQRFKITAVGYSGDLHKYENN